MPATSEYVLPIDPRRLLNAVSVALQRIPAASRDTAAAIPILQRVLNAAGPQDYASPLPANASALLPPGRAAAADAAAVAAEARQMRQFDAQLGALVVQQATDAARVLLAPPEHDALETYLRRWSGDAQARVHDLVTIGGGYSKQTSLLRFVRGDGRIEDFVMRRDVQLHVDTTVRKEYPLVVALHRQGFPVAEPILLATDVDGIPNPFMISRRAFGKGLGSPIEQGADVAFNPMHVLAEVLARLHAIPLRSLDLPGYSDVDFNADALLRHLGYWQQRYLQHRQVLSPTMDAAFTWLREHVADGLQPGVVVHGDCAFYNMLFDDDGKLLALLDWEMAHVGSPVWDLAYMRDHIRPYGSFDDFIERYVSHGGIAPSAAALRYYDVFRLIRNAVMSVTCVSLFNLGEPVYLDLLNVCTYLYPLSVQQLAALLAPAA